VNERSKARLFILKVTVASLLLTLGGRVWFLQVLAGDQYAAAAANNNRREIVEPATRGRILDVMGRPLVQNRTALVVSVDRIKLLRQPQHGAVVLARLAKVVHLPLTQLRNKMTLCSFVTKPGHANKVAAPEGCWNGSPYQPIQITDGADDAMAQQIEEQQELFPGVTAKLAAVRDYPKPDAVNAAHLLGYLSPITDAELKKDRTGDVVLEGTELVGRAGLESVYDDYLRGRPASSTVAVDARGAVTGTIAVDAGTPGASLVTNLDVEVQRATELALVHAVQRAHGMTDRDGKHYKADSAAAVVLDVTTGRVVAMASYPTYDPNVWVGGISQKDYAALSDEKAGVPLLFRPTQGAFAPGSTFKLVSTSAAVEAGFPLNGTYACPSSYRIGGRQFHNFEGESFGAMNLHTALVRSCDTVFYKFAYDEWLHDERIKKPREVFAAMAKAWHLGAKTGIDLADERRGRIASRAFKLANWKQLKAQWCKGAQTRPKGSYLQRLDFENCVDGYRYRAGDAANFAIGQGDTLVTPLQLASAYAALANGGTIYTPRLARAIVGADGKVLKSFAPVVAGHLPVSASVLDYIRSALGGVTTEQGGTARNAFNGFPLGQVHVAGKTGTAEVAGKQDTSWFASFAPVDHPKFAVVAMVTQGGQGARVAAPAVREIYDAIYGFEGAKAAFADGQLPKGLPKIAADGSVIPRPLITSRPTSSPSPTATALDAPAIVERRYRGVT
jgi:penicillin-binding protein 2